MLFSRRLSTVFTVNWHMSHSGVLLTLSCRDKGVGCTPSCPRATLSLFHHHPPCEAFPTLEMLEETKYKIRLPLSQSLDFEEHSRTEGVSTYPQHAQGLHHLLCEQRVEGQC